MLRSEALPNDLRLCAPRRWEIMGRSQDQFGPEGPEVWTSAAMLLSGCTGPAKRRRAAGDPNLKLETPHRTDSSQTPRWRKRDSNRRSHIPNGGSFETARSTLGALLLRQNRAAWSRGDRWFESHSLQRRVSVSREFAFPMSRSRGFPRVCADRADGVIGGDGRDGRGPARS